MKANINNAASIVILGSIMLFPVISHAQSLPPSGGNGDGATQSSSASSLPPSGGNNDGATSAPSNSSLPPSGGNNDGATPAPIEPVTPPSSGGGSSSVSSGGSSSSSGSSVGTYTGGNLLNSNVSVASTTSTSASSTTSPLAGSSCPLITNFLQIGADNNSADVIKLQAFLKTTEQLDVDLSGIFDTKTETGVKAFQAKYLADTMGPWKSATPSGKVYITTKNKINEIACNSAINLTSDEQATINSYLNGNQNSSTTIGTAGPSVPTTTPTIGENSNSSNANTASVVNAPVIQRVWNFIKGIFGK